MRSLIQGEVGMLHLFKSARRQEYLQENLRTISAPRGAVVETTYSKRWLPKSLLERPPAPGEDVLVTFASRPYERFTPVRLGSLAQVSADDASVRLFVRLGDYVRVPDTDRWTQYVLAGPNPSPSSQYFIRRDPEELVAPVEPVDVLHADRAWRHVVDRLGREDDYARAVFLRMTGALRVGGTEEYEPPLQLPGEAVYTIRLASYNPHLDADALRDTKIVAFHDELSASVILEDGKGIPRDGMIELAIEPVVLGVGAVELETMRGSEVLFGARIEWLATAPVVIPTRPPSEAVPTSVEPVVEEQTAATGQAGAPPSGLTSPPDGEALVRAFKLLRERAAAGLDLQQQMLGYLIDAAPSAPRLREWRAIVLLERGDHGPALAEFERLCEPPSLPEGRAAFVAATLRSGRLPDPLDTLRSADYSRADLFEMILDASAALSFSDQLIATRLLTDSVLSEERAVRWLEGLIARPTPRDDLRALIEIWSYVSPAGAAKALVALIDSGRLGLEDVRVAALAFELASEAALHRTSLAAAESLVDDAARSRDAGRLHSLLDQTRHRLRPRDYQLVGERITRVIADVVPEADQIDAALLAMADLVEDHRQQGNIDAAVSLGTCLKANEHRSAVEAHTQIGEVLGRLELAVEGTATMRRFEEMRRREENLDLRATIAGLRFVLVGAKRPDWWEPLRQELAISDRSVWVESEPRKGPPMDVLEAKVRQGTPAAVVVITDRIGHATSKPLIKLAKDSEIPLITTTLSREAVIRSLREHFPAAPSEPGD